MEKLHKIEQVDIRTKSLNDDTVPVLDSHPNLKSLAYQDSLITEKSFEKIIKSSTIKSMQLNSNPNIKSFGVLTQMSNLEYLMMQFTGVSDFRPVNDFAKLETIFAHGQKTVDTPIELKLSDLIWNEVKIETAKRYLNGEGSLKSLVRSFFCSSFNCSRIGTGIL